MRAFGVSKGIAESYLNDWITNGLIREGQVNSDTKMKGLGLAEGGKNELRSNGRSNTEQRSNHS
jgi:hypothetical protein